MIALRRSWGEIRDGLGPAPAPDSAAPLGPPPPDALPWFARVLVGVGAWLAAAFLVGFAALLIAHSEGGLLVFGAVLLVTGVGLLRTAAGDFFSQVGLATSLAGQALVIAMTGSLARSSELAALLALALELGLTFLIASPVHRFLCTVAAAGALAFELADVRAPHALDVAVLIIAAVAAWVWLTRAGRLARRGRDEWVASAYALVVAAFAVLLLGVLPGMADVREVGELRMGRLAGAGLGLGVVALGLVIRRGVRPGAALDPVSAVGLAALALLGLATPGAPGVVAGVGVLLLGFNGREPVLVGLAIVFEIVFLALLYYNLTATLLVKALLLVVSGVALLAAAAFLHRRRGS